MMKGNGTNCARIIPNSAVKFFTYETLSRHISNHLLESTGSGEMSPLTRLAAGAGAGVLAMSSTYPLDMVRGRLTVQEGRATQYRGIAHAATEIIKHEGPLALYKVRLGALLRGHCHVTVPPPAPRDQRFAPSPRTFALQQSVMRACACRMLPSASFLQPRWSLVIATF